MEAIEARALRKDYGTFHAVRGIDFSVPAGSVFGFLGPNGSGKSTTVKMFTGLLEPTAGEALINGRAVSRDPLAVKREIGVLPEGQALFESLTIWEHLTLTGAVYEIAEDETRRRGEELLRYLDLWEGRHTFIEQASYGMGKKCALAMALLHNPKVLFLDEPFEGIDPASTRNIRELIELLAGRGVTVFLTSHILEIVQRLASHFALIVNGAIVAEGAVEEGRSLEQIFFEHVERPRSEGLNWAG